MDLLSVRHQIKEALRAQLKAESGNCDGTIAGDKQITTTGDKYGSFFGPSEIVLADRLIQKAESWSDVSPTSILQELNGSPKNKNSGPETRPKTIATAIINVVQKKKKLQSIKYSRDYSFLSSDDCPVPVPVPTPGKKSVPRSETSRKEPVLNKPHVERSKIKNENSLKIPSAKNKDSKIRTGSKNQVVNIKSSNLSSDKCKTGLSKKELVDQNKSMGEKRKFVKALGTENARKKRKLEVEEEGEGEKAVGIIRRMFGYDPTKFCGDLDDKNMEASFSDIQKEERRSTKIARKEDAEELKKIMQEEIGEKKKRIIIRIKIPKSQV